MTEAPTVSGTAREFSTPPQGLIPPNFRTTPSGFRGKEGEREREGGEKGRGE